MEPADRGSTALKLRAKVFFSILSPPEAALLTEKLSHSFQHLSSKPTTPAPDKPRSVEFGLHCCLYNDRGATVRAEFPRAEDVRGREEKFQTFPQNWMLTVCKFLSCCTCEIFHPVPTIGGNLLLSPQCKRKLSQELQDSRKPGDMQEGRKRRSQDCEVRDSHPVWSVFQTRH
ncbi:hypothetical protein STEG23_033681, partial [Scotinomys teguina]